MVLRVQRYCPKEVGYPSISAEEIDEVEESLKKLKCSFPEASSDFREWVEQREKSIDTIDDLQKKVLKVHQVCHAARAAGSAMEVVGGVATLAGVILTACGHKSAGKFLIDKAATATTVTGVATTLSSSLAEVGLTCSVLKQMKAVLEKDEEYTRVLVNNLQISRKIDAQLKRVFNCSTFSNIFLDVVHLCLEAFSLLKAGYVECSNLANELQRRAQKSTSISEYTETAIQNVCTTIQRISHDPKIYESVQNICNILQKNPLLVDFVKFGIRTSFQVEDVLKGCSDLLTLGGQCALEMSVGAMAKKCVFSTVQVAVNVFAVMAAVKEAQKDSTKYSEMLGEIKMALSLELGSVRRNYSGLFLKC